MSIIESISYQQDVQYTHFEKLFAFLSVSHENLPISDMRDITPQFAGSRDLVHSSKSKLIGVFAKWQRL